MTTDLYVLPPDQWPERAAPPPPPRPARGGRRTAALFGVVALAAAVGIVAVAPTVVRQVGHHNTQSAQTSPLADAPPQSTTTTSGDAASDPTRAVFLINVNACGLQAMGSGFAIDAHHVVTNAHVVQGDPNPQLRTPTGDRFVGRVIGINGANHDGRSHEDGPPDVAVIEVDAALPGHLSWAGKAPAQGEVLRGVTFPEGVYTPTTGTVVDTAAQGFAIRGDFDHGSSGGAVLSKDGQVHGIITYGADTGGLAFAFEASVLKPIVDGILANAHPVTADCTSSA